MSTAAHGARTTPMTPFVSMPCACNEVGMIKSDPSKIIAQGTDWRLLNELKREL